GGNPGVEQGTGPRELVHLVGVPCEDGNELVAVVLEPGDHRINDLLLERRVLSALRAQLVRLVDEQHSTHCSVECLMRVRSRMTEVPALQLARGDGFHCRS